MAILACETFTARFCFTSHLGGTLIARLNDGALCFLQRGRETNDFRALIASAEAWNVDNLIAHYGKRMKRDKYVTVHKQGHYIQIHNRPLGDKSCTNISKSSSQELLPLWKA